MTNDLVRENIASDLCDILSRIKVAFGPMEVSSTLRKRPWISSFLRKSFADSLDNLENLVYTLDREKS